MPEEQRRRVERRERRGAFERERGDEEYVAEDPQDSLELAERQGEHTARDKQRAAESSAADTRRRGQRQYRHIYEYKRRRCQSKWIVSRRGVANLKIHMNAIRIKIGKTRTNRSRV